MTLSEIRQGDIELSDKDRTPSNHDDSRIRHPLDLMSYMGLSDNKITKMFDLGMFEKKGSSTHTNPCWGGWKYYIEPFRLSRPSSARCHDVWIGSFRSVPGFEAVDGGEDSHVVCRFRKCLQLI